MQFDLINNIIYSNTCLYAYDVIWVGANTNAKRTMFVVLLSCQSHCSTWWLQNWQAATDLWPSQVVGPPIGS